MKMASSPAVGHAGEGQHQQNGGTGSRRDDNAANSANRAVDTSGVEDGSDGDGISRRPPLIGSVTYRMQLDDGGGGIGSSNKKKKSRKRKRVTSNSEDTVDKDNNESNGGGSNGNADAGKDSVREGVPLAGWVFTEHSTGRVLLLSIPSVGGDLMDALHEASSSSSSLRVAAAEDSLVVDVRITRYELVPLLQRDEDRKNVPAGFPTSLAEVHSGGLEIVNRKKDRVDDQPSHQNDADVDDDLWTLAQIRRREVVDRIQKPTLPLYCIAGRQKYSVVADVNSISPIIAIDPSDPFALLELYDARSTLSCIVVIRKPALSCHATIFPGKRCVLKGVRKQQWRIPGTLVEKKGLEHLRNRIPSHVFVAECRNQIRCDGNDGGGSLRFDPPWPLTSVRGEVLSVHTIHVGEDKDHIHYVELRTPLDAAAAAASSAMSCNGEKQRQRRPNSITLFVTYYPMSSAMQLSLRPGAVIEATNIHSISGGTYCACLRSTVALVRNASESAKPARPHQQSPQEERRKQHQTYLSLPRTRPFDFLKIRKTYPEFLCRQMVSILLQDLSALVDVKANCGNGVAECKGRQLQVPVAEEFTKALLLCSTNEKFSSQGSGSSRNPYAEFFDHALEAEQEDDEGANVDSKTPMKCNGCHMTRCELSNAPELPLVAVLSDVYELSMRLLGKRLAACTASSSSKDIQFGWSGSIVLTARDLSTDGNCFLGLQSLSGQQQLPSESLIQVFGAANCTITDGQVHGSLSNGRHTIPVSFAANSHHSAFVERKHQIVMVGMRAVVLSFLCIETPVKGKLRSGSKTIYLPTYTGAAAGRELGSCAIVTRNSYRFVVSAYLECQRMGLVGGGEEKVADYHMDLRAHVGSIQDCLDPSIPRQDSSKAFVGLLERKFCKIVKARNSTYKGFMISLSHVSPHSNTYPFLSCEEVVTLQSIEIKAGTKVDRKKYHLIRQLLESALGKSLREEQLVLILFWWRTGSSGSTCALLGGGWDEISPQASMTARRTGVVVRVPQSAVQPDSKRGYVRFRCSLDELMASPISFSEGVATMPSCRITSNTSVDFIGGRRFLPGMVSGRPRRKALFDDQNKRVAIGEMLVTPRHAGVPSNSLADLHWAICADLRTRSRFNLAPSLVRKVHHATFLGISFCRALAECNKCYHTLEFPPVFKTSQKTTKGNKGVDGIVTSVTSAVESSEPATKSFWNNPRPPNAPNGSTSNGQSTRKTSAWEPTENCNGVQKNICSTRQVATTTPTTKTQLRCPNSCSLEHAAIKWECSGTLDDGTGQAKLYAERDAALMLLGMSVSVVEEIEAGAWQNENGVIFSRAMPPKESIRRTVMTARAMAQDQLRLAQSHRRRGQLQEADVLKFMTTEARAEYWMDRHCRGSGCIQHEATSSPCEMTYYVRCKPLSDEMAVSLNQTQIDLITTASAGIGDGSDDYARLRLGRKPVPTYTLPPLKLNLVDCCSSAPANDARADDDAS